MTTRKYVREAELTQLLHDLDAIAVIVAELCNSSPHNRHLNFDDLNWAVRVIDKAANFVKQSREEGVES